MRRNPNRWAALGLGAILGLASTTYGQQPPAKGEATAVVDGVVREVFRSPRQGRVDVLVQLDVLRSELGKAPRNAGRVTCPAPGESIYVHLSQATDVFGKPANAGQVPTELTQVRAYLVPRGQGGWEGTAPEWFDVTSDRPVARAPGEPGPAAADAAPTTPPPSTPPPANGKVVLSSLGITADPVDVQGRFVLKVTGLERGSPGQKAGLEVGDIIAGLNGEILKNSAQLDDASRKGAPLTLIVIDINSGKAAQVEVAPAVVAADPAQPRAAEPAPAPTAPPRSLGISAETVNIGGRTALKVVRVDPDSPAAKAGIEVGDVLVGANGAAITGPEQLAAALRKSNGTLSLQVRDVRSGRDTPVEVNLGGAQKPAPPITVPGLPGNPAPNNPGAGGDRLGVVTELTFHDTEAAVKITEVRPGGAAAQAGLRPGMIITKADGKAVLHPNDMTEAARKAGNAIRLSIVDPTSGRQGDVNVDLGR